MQQRQGLQHPHTQRAIIWTKLSPMTVIGYAFYAVFALTEKDKLMLKKILLLTLLPGAAFAEELPAPVKSIEKQGITIIKSFDAPGG